MRKKLKRCYSLAVVVLLAAAALGAQLRGFQAAVALPPPPITVKAGETFELPLTVRIRKGYHINSDQPLEEYLIPTRLTWNTPGFEVLATEFPEAELVQYDFSDGPLSVFSGEFAVTTKLRAPKSLGDKPVTLTGKLRYQACNDKACLAPTSLDVSAVVR